MRGPFRIAAFLCFVALTTQFPKAVLATEGNAALSAAMPAVEIEAAVLKNYEKGWQIAVVQLTNPKPFKPTSGPEGMSYAAGPGCIVLLSGKYEAPVKEGTALTLQAPYPKQTKVILLQHPGGQWIEYSEENVTRIKAVLEKLRAAAEAKIMRS